MGAKPPGVLRGITKIYGFKQECDIIHYEFPQQSRPFKTMYSAAFLDGYALMGIQNVTCDPATTYFMRFDVCLPKSCNANDILTIIKNGMLVQIKYDI